MLKALGPTSWGLGFSLCGGRGGRVKATDAGFANGKLASSSPARGGTTKVPVFWLRRKPQTLPIATTCPDWKFTDRRHVAASTYGMILLLLCQLTCRLSIVSSCLRPTRTCWTIARWCCHPFERPASRSTRWRLGPLMRANRGWHQLTASVTVIFHTGGR
jgi:hypothetical protein